MSDHDKRMNTLDAAVRDMLVGELGDVELVSSWIVVASTRDLDNGGVVITIPSDHVMPQWEARGILATALRSIDRAEGSDQ